MAEPFAEKYALGRLPEVDTRPRSIHLPYARATRSIPMTNRPSTPSARLAPRPCVPSFYYLVTMEDGLETLYLLSPQCIDGVSIISPTKLPSRLFCPWASLIGASPKPAQSGAIAP